MKRAATERWHQNLTFTVSLFAAAIALSTHSSKAFPQQSAALPSSPEAVTTPPAATGLAAAPLDLQAALDESVLPRTVRELLVELSKRADEVQQTIASGSLGAVWVPAMSTKTVALAIERYADDFSEGQRAAAVAAIKQIVTAAWDLDAYGDTGDKEKVTVAYARLARGVSMLKTAYESR